MLVGDKIDEVIMEAIGSCAVLLALIGPTWLIERDDHGKPRLEDPNDFVRREIEVALQGDVRLIPVLLDGTHMPRADELPPSIRALAARNAAKLNHSSFNSDVRELITAIAKVLAESTDPADEPTRPDSQRPVRRLGRIVGVVTALVLAAAAIPGTAFYFASRHHQGRPDAGGHSKDTGRPGSGTRQPTNSPNPSSPAPSTTPSSGAAHPSGCKPINVANAPISGLIGVFAVKSYIPESVAFKPGGKIIAVATATNHQAGRTYLWNPAARTAVLLHDPGSKGAESVAFNPTGDFVAVGDANGHAYLWDLATCRVKASRRVTKLRGVQAVAFSPLASRVAIGDNVGNVYLWNPTNAVTTSLDDSGGFGAQAIAFNQNATLLAVGDTDDSTYLWDPRTGQAMKRLTDPGGASVLAVAIGRQGGLLAAGDSIGAVYLWNLASHKLARRINDPNGASVQAVAFNSGGTTIAIGDSDGWTYIFGLAGGKKPIARFHVQAQDFGVSSVAFSPDGTELAVADHNGTTYLWPVPASAR